MEVEFAAPTATRMVIELEGGLRLLVADDAAVELDAQPAAIPDQTVS